MIKYFNLTDVAIPYLIFFLFLSLSWVAGFQKEKIL